MADRFGQDVPKVIFNEGQFRFRFEIDPCIFKFQLLYKFQLLIHLVYKHNVTYNVRRVSNIVAVKWVILQQFMQVVTMNWRNEPKEH